MLIRTRSRLLIHSALRLPHPCLHKLMEDSMDVPELVSHQSSLNSSVQLFELPPTSTLLAGATNAQITPRRSTRLGHRAASVLTPNVSPTKRRASSLSSLSSQSSSADDHSGSKPTPGPSTTKASVRKQVRKRVKVEKIKSEVKEEEETLVLLSTEAKKTLTKRTRTVKKEASSSSLVKKKALAKQKGVKHALDNPHPEPEGWKDVYTAIREYRFRMLNVPVDTMGCATANWKETSDRNKRFITLVSLILSPQTTDESCARAVDQLQKELGGTISIENVLAASEERIYSAIRPAGFRKKATYLKETAEILRDKFDSDVPKTVEELCTLRGVREKVAFLTLQVAWGVNTGIGVDTHVHRITNRLGWHKPETKDPEETRLNLQSWLPSALYRDINTVLVGYGQMVCLPKNPRCDLCPVSHLCPSARTVPAKEKKGGRVVEVAGPRVEVSFEEILREVGEEVGKPFPGRHDPVAAVEARRVNAKVELNEGKGEGEAGEKKGEEW